ncbi:hypothetical protein TYRP_005108 [Tyrophagus putrescentiae]|nr:hypothetical protein TYRP_005108 [Tyrophagus putrescentiae]
MSSLYTCASFFFISTIADHRLQSFFFFSVLSGCLLLLGSGNGRGGGGVAIHLATFLVCLLAHHGQLLTVGSKFRQVVVMVMEVMVIAAATSYFAAGKSIS